MEERTGASKKKKKKKPRACPLAWMEVMEEVVVGEVLIESVRTTRFLWEF